MSFLNELQPNKPTASFDGYFISMLAKSKYGKTTFAIDLARKFYGNLDSTLLLATEIGYKAMSGVFAIPITGFENPEDDNGEQRGFIEVIDELIENKNNIPFKFIIIDTITALERYAIAYAIKKANRQDNPDTRYKDISDIPWGKGYNMVAEFIYEQIDRLKRSGYGIFLIGHEKEQKKTTKDGFEYHFTTFNAQRKTADIIEREADMIIYGDIQAKDIGGKIKDQRTLRFRSDGNILCGTRFRNFPETIDSDVDKFIEVFKDAILSLYDGDEKAVEKARKEQEQVKQEKVEAFIEEETKKPSEIHDEIFALVTELENEEKKELVDYFKEKLGSGNFRESEDIKSLEEALKYVKINYGK